MPPLGLEYLQHVLSEAEYLMQCAEGLDKDEFLGDETLKTGFRAQPRGDRRGGQTSTR